MGLQNYIINMARMESLSLVELRKEIRVNPQNFSTIVRIIIDQKGYIESHRNFTFNVIHCISDQDVDRPEVQRLLNIAKEAGLYREKEAEALLLRVIKDGDATFAYALLDRNFPVSDQMFFEALYSKMSGVALRLIERGVNVNGITKNGRSALFCATSHPEFHEVVLKLLENGADVHALSVNKGSVLNNACANKCHIETIQALLNAGADVSQMDGYGHSPLLYACQHGLSSAASLLIQNGAYVNFVNPIRGMSPLHYACSHGFQDIMEELLDGGANINIVMPSNG
jgi:ankyrin repeat protein